MRAPRLMSMSIVVLGIALAASSARAEKVALLPASGVNVHEGTLEAAQDILRGELMKTGRFQIAQVPGAVTKQEASLDDAVAAARMQSAELAAVLHVTRLGNVARLRLTAYHSGNGQVVYVDELPAASPDDMPAVLARLAQGFATGKPAADNAEIDSVTEKEQTAYRKRRATNVFGLELGYLLPLNDPRDGEGEQLALPGFALFWLYDARTFLADVAVGFHTDGDEGDFWVGLGVYYPFSRKDFAPYVGGGLRYAFTQYGGDGGSGMVALISGGVLLGRLSTVQIRGEVQYFFNLFRERPEEIAEGMFIGEPTRSHGIGVNLGIGF